MGNPFLKNIGLGNIFRQHLVLQENSRRIPSEIPECIHGVMHWGRSFVPDHWPCADRFKTPTMQGLIKHVLRNQTFCKCRHFICIYAVCRCVLFFNFFLEFSKVCGIKNLHFDLNSIAVNVLWKTIWIIVAFTEMSRKKKTNEGKKSNQKVSSYFVSYIICMAEEEERQHIEFRYSGFFFLLSGRPIAGIVSVLKAAFYGTERRKIRPQSYNSQWDTKYNIF